MIRRYWWVAGLLIAAMVVIVLAPLASDDPDGLERVAIDAGFAEQGTDAGFELLPDYSVPFLGERRDQREDEDRYPRGEHRRRRERAAHGGNPTYETAPPRFRPRGGRRAPQRTIRRAATDRTCRSRPDRRP